MNTMISAILFSMITVGGISLAVAGDDNNEYHGKYDGKYCQHGDGYKMSHNMGHYKKGHHRAGMEFRMQRMMRHLELSDEQQTQIQSIFDKYRKQLDTIRTEKMSNRQKLRQNMQTEVQDQTTIEKLAKQRGELVTQKILTKAKIKSEINQVLTSKQREKMNMMRDKYGQGRGQ